MRCCRRAGPGRELRGVRRAVHGDHPGSVADDATRLPGIALPGFANAHSHAFHRAMRGRTHRDGGTFWTWREAMYAVAAQLDPDSYLARWPGPHTPKWHWPV